MTVEVCKILVWMKINRLSLNIKTTHVMLFFRKKLSDMSLDIRIDGVRVETVTTASFLGIILHNDLQWKYQIEKLSSKIAKGIGILKKSQM